MAAVMPVNNETEARLTRTTKEGHELLYELKVIQQPERARACGSGAKCKWDPHRRNRICLTFPTASADRRPVDPPPVVELKIYEGEEKRDVTFSHNANFFLFTTLEPARKIAHGRVPQAQAMAPVLTGAPVGGMVYLDRPNPAGYFIFPDLSVRHEGQYRLSFSLYEDVKEAKDADQTPPRSATRTAGSPMAPRAHVHFRLEVKSVPFFVFSAKKFPGLSESTPLSRQVAEQGCRVRIRRDIRVRRRENKATEGYNNAVEEGHYGTSERYATPQHTPDRPRSISHGSMDARPPFNLQRQPSFETPGYHPSSAYAPTPPLAPINPPTSSYQPTPLNFSGSSTPTYHTPTYPKTLMNTPLPPPPPPPSTSQQYPPPSNNSQYPPTFHSRQMSAPYNYSYQPSQQPQPSSSLSQTHKEEYQHPPEPRRSSIGASLNREPQQFYGSRVSYPPGLQQNDMHSQSGNRDGRSLTPINTDAHIGRHNIPSLTNVLDVPSILHTEQPQSPTTSDPSGMPLGPQDPYKTMSLTSVANATVTPQCSASTYSLTTPHSATSDPSTTSTSGLHKRAYGQSFDTSHFNAPQHSGMRPDPNHHARDVSVIESDDAGQLHGLYNNLPEQLTYRRADGTTQLKHCLTRSPPKSQ